MSMPRTIEEWQDRYYEQQALHTEATGILGQERDSWKRKAEVAQRENAALREALTKIASRGVEPRIRPTGEKMAAGCATCQHWWDVDETEHHDPDCAFIVARDALAGQPCNQTNSQEPRQGVASTGEAITTGGGNPSGGTEKPSRGHEAHRAGTEREHGIRAAWDAIAALIRTGELPTTWEHEQRNGLVLAANAVAGLMGWPVAQYAESHSQVTDFGEVAARLDTGHETDRSEESKQEPSR